MKKSASLRLQINLEGKPQPGAYIISSMSGDELKIAVHILDMIPDDGFWNYRTMSELEKKVIWGYWRRYCGMPEIGPIEEWRRWFFSESCLNPERIRRPFKELHSSKHHQPYIEIKPQVLEMAKKAERNYRRNLGYGDNLL